jgi:hypothetical protein
MQSFCFNWCVLFLSWHTIGLGDFYLPSQQIFYFDLFVWAFSFLTGFTFLSTFVGNTVEVMGGCLPDFGERFNNTLLSLSSKTATTATTIKPVLYLKEQNEDEDDTTNRNNEIENEKYIDEVLDEKVKEITINENGNSGDDDDDNDLDIQVDSDLITKNLNRIHMKKKLLLRLLQGTNQELEYYQMHKVGFDSLLVKPNNNNRNNNGSTIISYQEEEESMLNNNSSSSNNNGSSYNNISSPSSYSMPYKHSSNTTSSNTIGKLY